MSYRPAPDPQCERVANGIDLLIDPQEKDLGGFSVRRVLPSPERRMVGPFIFFDHFGPAIFPPGEGIQVRPHPHIGIATVSYLIEGAIVHRDNLGYTQVIDPGAVNLMTAGRGVVHSERAGDDLMETSRLHGLQLWIALPDHLERTEPGFVHYPAADLPAFEEDAAHLRVVMGTLRGRTSPVHQHSPTLYVECSLPAGGAWELPPEQPELAFYTLSGEVRVGSTVVPAGRMAVLHGGVAVPLQAETDSRLVVIGGEPVGQRHIWWNFVASDKAMIEQAKADWREGRFGRVEGDDEFIPLPET